LWFSPGTPVSPTHKTDRHDLTEILLKVALSIINQTKPLSYIASGIKYYYYIAFLYTSIYGITEILLKVALSTITVTV
jgi:hypothetical protein